MGDIRSVNKSGRTRNRRVIRLDPMTRAVRSVLAVSALTLGIGLTGNASAASYRLPAAMMHALQTQRTAIDVAPVFDLTTVPQAAGFGADSTPFVATLIGIDEHQSGDVVVDNADPLSVFDLYSDAIAIRGYSDAGDVTISNNATGTLQAQSFYASAIGIYGYATTGDTTISNAADINVLANWGLADGIFASGTNVDIENTGDITATGYTWAAGIEARGSESSTVTNDGAITVTATGWGGNANGPYAAYGIYASSTYGNATVVNGIGGSITSYGYYATGIRTQTYGDAEVGNAGAIVAGSMVYSALAWGIHSETSGEGAAIQIENAGDIQTAAIYGAVGIQAISSGVGGTAAVNNSGDIAALQNRLMTSYGAYAILVSADGDSSINNSGDIVVASKGPAFGLAAMSFAGEASVTNEGDVTVGSTVNSTSVTPTGLLAFGANGTASVDNSGTVVASGVRRAAGIDASAYGDVAIGNSGDVSAYATGLFTNTRADGVKAVSGSGTVTLDNSGSIYASGTTVGLGVYAVAENGDIVVNNEAGGSIGAYSFAGIARGVFAYATNGDIDIDNAGIIDVYGWTQTYGVLARAPAGDTGVDNSGTIYARSGSNKVTGVLASTDEGTAAITNSGDIQVISRTGSYGMRAIGYAGADAGNSGSIYAASTNGVAVGMLAQAGDGNATVANTGGSIEVKAATAAFGVFADSAYGDVSVTNASAISALGVNSAATGIRATASGDVDIANSADIEALSNGNAIGIYGYSVAADVAVDNTGDITAVSYYGLADGIFVSGANVDVANAGAIIAAGNSWAAGIEAQGASDAVVQNSGDIYAVAMGPGGRAFGLYGTGGTSLDIGNSGSLEAQGYYATGIEASALGDIAVDSSGSIVAGYANADGDFYSALATGINANSNGEGAAVEVGNGGDIAAIGFFGANGIAATSSGQGGTVDVGNDGDIAVLQGNKYGYGAYGIFASGDGDTGIANHGTISAYSAGAATGAAALSFAGDAHVVNSGDIEAISTATAYYGATGILAFGANGSASVQNSGSVTASAAGLLYSEARAVDAQALGDVTVGNSGSLYANGEKYAFGVYAVSGSGDLAVSNSASGEIGFYSYIGRGWGVFGVATQGDVSIANTGDISGYAYGQSAGVFAVAGEGNAKVTNSGDIAVASGSDVAVGAFARANNGTASVTNSGDIEATSAYAAYGVMARGKTAVVTNSGSISAEGYVASIGVFANGATSTVVNNSGAIHAGAAGFNAGVMFGNAAGNVLNNTGAGVVSATGEEGYAFAVVGGSAGDTINNSARILGAVSMYGGADVFNNRAGGLWDVGSSYSTDFGSGDDTINNLAGGTIRLAGGALSLGGAVAGNAFNNAGTIRVFGDGNLIHMGMAGTAANPLPLANTGLIDFVDGTTDDVLYIGGHLGGTGAINIDLDLAELASDQLVVLGNMASGAAQSVNVRITEMPTTASTTAVQFAHVTGSSAAGSFVGGKVLGYSESNFLDIGARTSRLAGTGGTASFLVALDVLGMNDTGALAATTATAAASFLNSQIGTFRQRLGVNPYGDADKVMNAFVRFYTSEGDLAPAHHAANFGQGGSFGFAQSNWGREVGVNANLPGNLHAGIVLGNADSRQRLNAGTGENRMDGTTVGAYATWYAPGGFYVDLSGRWMASDIRSTTAAGVMAGRVHAQATSLEAGYEWKFGSVNLVPQAQYTRTKVDGLDALHGDMASFQSHGGTFEQGRLGVELNRSFDAAGLRWTPYGSINAIREFDGKTTYTVADNFFGSTSTKGTSTMAELGLGVQRGRFGFGLGLNWTDGGAYKSMIGGQASARFSW